MLRKMKARPVLALTAMLFVLTTGSVSAGDWRGDLPPDDRRELRRQMREHWQQESGERRPVLHDDRPSHWRELPREERQRLRDEMRQQNDRDWRYDRKRRRND